ncbi:uncharacterized protein LOC123655097 [Melitaea cinxia]|uniref:uncharacterized protein LOC123655097 n=1 Tax=Melitaea cinxia TaxID=113334 RepID=UPI001E270BA6|nr:uncharacterized protein LOC123655097 [Melitaea cinxia]
MIKRSIFFITLWTLSHAAYISRMAMMNRMRAPVAFRPGIIFQRPGYPQRIVPAASRRAPYIIYRNTPPRYTIKHNINPAMTRNVYNHWKTTRLPLPSPTAEYEFVRPTSPPAIVHPDVVDKDNSVQSCLNVGAIHTIPAPNLSLSEKPIVVAESDITGANDASKPKPTYEVTEKYSDQPVYQVNPKIEAPVGFSKASSMSAADLQNIVKQNTALQLASEYGFQLPHPTTIPQQFAIQGFHGFTNHHDFFHSGAENIIVPQSAYYQQDPIFLHNLQSQIIEQYPSVEFRPYTPEVQPQVQTQIPETHTPLFLLQNEQIIKQAPSSFVTSNNNERNIVQRETQESSIASIVPQGFSVKNVSENLIEIDVTTEFLPQNVQNVTTETTEIQAPTTTVKNVVEINKDDKRTTPIYYAQIGQSVGNVIANGFYSAINDVRAASMEAQNNQSENITTTTTSTTTERETQPLFVDEKTDSNIDDLTNLLASPFEKPAESVNVAYTLLRASDKQPKVNQDGEVFAGQLVEAKISEDQEFNKEKATLASRPPLRLFAVTEKRVSETTPQQTVVKAKIPPKSKLIFDEKTGEPVLRIYASYVDNPAQKEILTAKLTNMRHTKEVTRKQDSFDWKTDAVKNIEQLMTGDNSQFGLKMRSRSDDYIPIFEDYEE